MDILANTLPAVRATQAIPGGREAWSALLGSAFRTPRQLARWLELPGGWVKESLADVPEFPLFAPQPFVARMERGNPHDPLLRQVWPAREERQPVEGFVADPLREDAVQRAPGILQKYAGRALLITTGACGIHCRYCFRRHWEYDRSPTTLSEWRAAVDGIARDDSITEVILSGGDPLTWPDVKLKELVGWLDAVPHLRRLRIHSRMPIVIPQRMTPGLFEALETARLERVLVVHANHVRELDGDVESASAAARRHGWTLLNQAVLLAGVNDSLESLRALSERLLAVGVLPYYLHQVDRVAGAAHFYLPPERGVELTRQLRNHLPGYLVPRFVCEQPGAPAKTVLA